MRDPRGYFISTDPDPPKGRPGVIEVDTITCIHCNRVEFIQVVQKLARCTRCDDWICSRCIGKPCDHIEKKLARMEAVRSYG